jgi:hypothetical protein
MKHIIIISHFLIKKHKNMSIKNRKHKVIAFLIKHQSNDKYQ